MKRAQKKVFGLFGLVLVAAMTVFAATLPTPEASAVSTMTDTIVVRVVGDKPEVNITTPGDRVYTRPNQTVSLTYENVGSLTVRLKFVDKDGNVHEDILEDIDNIGYTPGDRTLNINLNDYGYGDYTITALGTGEDGVSDDDVIEFKYIPITGTVEQDDKEGGDPTLVLDYDEDSEIINKIGIVLYDENGNIIESVPPIVVTPPTKEVSLPFYSYDLPPGKYIIEITTYDQNDNILYRSYEIFYIYAPKGEDLVVPNTGANSSGLNISKIDYLATGLLVFFSAGIIGLFFVARGKKSQKKRR